MAPKRATLKQSETAIQLSSATWTCLRYFTSMLHAHYGSFLRLSTPATDRRHHPDYQPQRGLRGGFESRGGLIPLGLLLPLRPLGARDALLESRNVVVQLKEELRDGLCLCPVSSMAGFVELTNSLYRVMSPETAARSRARRSRRTFSSAWPFSSAEARVVISEQGQLRFGSTAAGS